MPKRYLLTFLFVVLAAVLLWGYTTFRPFSKETITNYPSSGTDIVAFGDSLVAGNGATEGHDLVSLLSQKIGQHIINLGVAGDTTSRALARVSDLDKYHPKVVLLLVGGNDYLERHSMNEAFLALGQIIENIQSRGAVVVLVGQSMGPFIGNFDSEYKKISQTYHTAYVPNVLQGFYTDPAYMADPIHPNDAGYEIMAKRIAPVLLKVVQ